MKKYVVTDRFGQVIYSTYSEREAAMVARKYNGEYYSERR